MTIFLLSMAAFCACLIWAAVDVIRSRQRIRALEAALKFAREQNVKLLAAKLTELGYQVKGDPMCPRDSVFMFNSQYLVSEKP